MGGAGEPVNLSISQHVPKLTAIKHSPPPMVRGPKLLSHQVPSNLIRTDGAQEVLVGNTWAKRVTQKEDQGKVTGQSHTSKDPYRSFPTIGDLPTTEFLKG